MSLTTTVIDTPRFAHARKASMCLMYVALSPACLSLGFVDPQAAEALAKEQAEAAARAAEAEAAEARRRLEEQRQVRISHRVRRGAAWRGGSCLCCPDFRFLRGREGLFLLVWPCGGRPVLV